MDFTISTPAMVFPAISLLMLAYTNRFLTLAGLVRDLIKEHQEKKDDNIFGQIQNLQKRMSTIRKMQIWGALSFACAVISMLLMINNNLKLYAVIVFSISLVFLLISLAYLVFELHISINALTLQLDKIKEEKTSSS